MRLATTHKIDGNNMPRNMQRTPLELGLQLNINRLISDGFIQPGKSDSAVRFLLARR